MESLLNKDEKKDKIENDDRLKEKQTSSTKNRKQHHITLRHPPKTSPSYLENRK